MADKREVAEPLAEKREGRHVLVTGATGKQGGAVARHLLKRGWRVRALTRDPAKAAARALEQLGAEVVRGDLNDPASYTSALAGAYGVFSVQQFWETGFEGEVRQGKALADAAARARVRHFVYSSVGSAHRGTGLPHFESKWQIEEHVRGLKLPSTIFRPVFFMDNWDMPALREAILAGSLPQPLDPDTSLQQVAVDDVGAFVALAFENPDEWLGEEVDLAGDELTMPEVATTFTRMLGRTVTHVQPSMDEFRAVAGEEMARMYEWFDAVGYEADIAALQDEYLELTTLERYLQQHPDWSRQAKV